jgi:GT2 family glycosyltransferase
MTSISVVIPTHDRPAALVRCLEGVAAMRGAGPDLEVVVVNDGGAPLPAAARERLARGLDLTVVQQRRAGPPAARNAGAERARGTFVALLDDDCVPDAGWLAALAARFADAPGVALGGRTVNALPDNPFSSASQLLVDYLYARQNADGGPATFFASNNLALPRRALLALGGFDVSFRRPAGEDRDLCDRWQRAGHRMVFAPEAIVLHAHALGPAAFWRQHFAYGRGAYAFRRARALRDGVRIALEPWQFYAQLVRAPFATDGRRRADGLASLLVVAQLANAAGYAWERTRDASPA